MAEIELFSYAACPYAQRTRIALIEKGLPFDLHEIDLANRPPWFREVSPYGKVPVLRHAGRVVYESAIINQYLDEAFPDPPLMPADPYGRAQARIWMDYLETRYLPAAHRLMAERADAAKLKANRGKLTEIMQFMEHEGLRKLGEGPYWMGPKLTLVDCQYLPFFERFGVYVELAGAEWPEDCTRLRRWYEVASQCRGFVETSRDLSYHLDQQRRLSAMRQAAAAGRATGT